MGTVRARPPLSADVLRLTVHYLEARGKKGCDPLYDRHLISGASATVSLNLLYPLREIGW